jgi:hypothetical protein
LQKERKELKRVLKLVKDKKHEKQRDSDHDDKGGSHKRGRHDSP